MPIIALTICVCFVLASAIMSADNPSPVIIAGSGHVAPDTAGKANSNELRYIFAYSSWHDTSFPVYGGHELPDPVPPLITTETLPDGLTGTAYMPTLTALGNILITWEVVGGSLPNGLSLNPKSGAFSGIPTKSGAFTFIVRAANEAGFDEKEFTVIVIASCLAPTITTESLQAGTLGRAYSQTLAATGNAPIIWNISSDALPLGLSLDATTGVISGTPTRTGTFHFTVKAANDAGEDDKTLSITVMPSGNTVGGGLRIWAIAFIAVGSLCILVLSGLGIYWFIIKKGTS
jgi:hypothetical protein